MVAKTPNRLAPGETGSYQLTITLTFNDNVTRDSLLRALEPEFPAINSKRVLLQVKPTDKHLEFHLTAKDVTAMRAATTSLIRLYCVADGVLQMSVKKND